MLQSRLHFRIHSAQTELRAKIKASKRGSEEEDDEISPLPMMETSNFEIPVTEDEAKKLIQAR